MTLHEEVGQRAEDEPQAPDEGLLESGAVPPPTEEIHLPDPSYLPVTLAFGITVALVGLVLTYIACIIGGLIALVALVKWIRLAREDMAELPLEH